MDVPVVTQTGPHDPKAQRTVEIPQGRCASRVSRPRAGAKTSVEEPPVAVQATDPLNCTKGRARADVSSVCLTTAARGRVQLDSACRFLGLESSDGDGGAPDPVR